MRHVLITYCTLKIIYFAGIAFICNVDAEAQDGHLGRRGVKNINYNKVNDLFFLSVSKVCVRLIQEVSVQGVYVLEGICPRGICPGGKCPGGRCLGGGGGGLCPRTAHLILATTGSLYITEVGQNLRLVKA